MTQFLSFSPGISGRTCSCLRRSSSAKVIVDFDNDVEARACCGVHGCIDATGEGATADDCCCRSLTTVCAFRHVLLIERSLILESSSISRLLHKLTFALR